ncbi:MAG: protein kinase [Lachnospiraceae bacterium]|nr:protein kinase [Lachnospiraceae bacterium]
MEKYFGDYKIDCIIGNGAYGKAYRIVREEFGHTYEACLKIIELPADQTEVSSLQQEGMTIENVTEYYRSMAENFVKEFELMSKLKGNSYIVSYEDHKVIEKQNEFGWKIYIKMELLTPLLEYIRKNGMTYYDVLNLGIHVCNALELCKKNHIIHRDIKPDNIFVSNNGEFKLGDFGVAKQMEQSEMALSRKGTKSFMAPEIFKGNPYNASVDIYSLGIVLYRFLNRNRLPFMPQAPLPIHFSDKENAQNKRLRGDVMPHPSDASEKLSQIILKACAYQPEDRYQDPRLLREALEKVMQEEENFVLFEPTPDDSFMKTTTSFSSNSQEEDQKTVLLGSNNTFSQSNIMKQPTLSSITNSNVSIGAEDRTELVDGNDRTELFTGPPPTAKKSNKKLLFFAFGGIAAACLCIFLVSMLAINRGSKSSKAEIRLNEAASNVKSTPEVTKAPKLTETPKVTETPKPTKAPTKKPTHTKAPIRKPTPTRKPVVVTKAPIRKPTPTRKAVVVTKAPTKKPIPKATKNDVIIIDTENGEVQINDPN